MIIRNKRVTLVSDVELSDSEVNEMVLGKLYKMFSWGPNYFIRNNQVWNSKEYITSHRFDMDEVVRDATEEDHKTQDLINTVLQKMKER